MTFLRSSIAVLTIVLIAACSGKKAVGDEAANAEMTEAAKEMLAKGFTEGTVVASNKEGDCPFAIMVSSEESGDYYLDPINLEEMYKKDGQVVWFKFAGLRMMNRCEKASPINLTEIYMKM